MDVIRLLAERKIEEAMEQGAFDNLPGCGRPLQWDTSPWEDPERRVGFKVLKNAGILPPEMQLRKEMEELRRQIYACRDAERTRRIQHALEEKRVRCRILVGYSRV